jgi:phytol kinase
MTLRDALAIVAVLGAAIAMLSLLSVGSRIMPVTPEQLRKLAHIGTGALTMTFPWIFSSYIPVLVVCSLSVLLLLGIQYYSPLQASMSGVLHGVKRQSRGDIYFPISVAILFTLAHGSKLLYVVPILVLTFADTVAALLGEQYGKHGYHGLGGIKSMEGSIGFFTTAFFAVHIPLLLFTQLGRAETLLIAVDIGLIVTLLEAIAWRGLDNIFIPLGVFGLLHIYTTMPLRYLVARLVVATALLIFVALYRSRTTLETSALLASTLVLYASWGLGGWRWLIAPATLFVTYTLFCPDRQPREDRTHNVYSVIGVSSAGLAWLFLAALTGGTVLLFPYTLGYAIHLAILRQTLGAFSKPERRVRWIRPLLVLEAWLLMFIPFAVEQRLSRVSLIESAVALPLIGLAFALFRAIEPRTDGLYSLGVMRWLRQGVIVLLATIVAVGASVAL